MEIIKNREERLRNAILNGNSKRLKEFFIEKDKLENKLISCYENTYKFMEFRFIVTLEEINNIQEVVKDLLVKSNFTVNSNIPLCEVYNSMNNTNVILNYFYKDNSFSLDFKNEELGIIENIELDDKEEIENLVKTGKKQTFEGFLKNCLYKYNVENIKRF